VNVMKIKSLLFSLVIAVLVIATIYLLYDKIFKNHLPDDLTAHEKEMIRKTSPDSTLDAILMYDDFGPATNPVSYHLYIAEKDHNPQPRTQILVATKIEELDFTWTDNRTLEVTYANADIYTFTNFDYLYGRIDINLSRK